MTRILLQCAGNLLIAVKFRDECFLLSIFIDQKIVLFVRVRDFLEIVIKYLQIVIKISIIRSFLVTLFAVFSQPK